MQDRDLQRDFVRHCPVGVLSVSEVPATSAVRLRMQTPLDLKLRCHDAPMVTMCQCTTTNHIINIVLGEAKNSRTIALVSRKQICLAMQINTKTKGSNFISSGKILPYVARRHTTTCLSSSVTSYLLSLRVAPTNPSTFMIPQPKLRRA